MVAHCGGHDPRARSRYPEPVKGRGHAGGERLAGDPYGTRTRVFAVRGRRPRPLDEGAIAIASGAYVILRRLRQSGAADLVGFRGTGGKELPDMLGNALGRMAISVRKGRTAHRRARDRIEQADNAVDDATLVGAD